MRRRPTQRDIATKAGVSQATVSMVLGGANTPSNISAETVGRIHEIAKQLGYVPNRFAQALKTRKTMTIACIVPDITNPFYPGLVRGVQKIAQDNNYDVITANTDGEQPREQHFLQWAREGRVDGVIGVFFNLRAVDFTEVLDTGVPVVRIESSLKTGGLLAIDDIFIDNKAASKAMVESLIRSGRHRIAMVAGRGGPQRMRVDGYLEAVTEAALEPLVIVDDAFNDTGGFRAAEKVLGSNFDPNAIFAANDLMAIGVMQALQERGIAIPDDIAVAGFDDIPAARLVSPPLSTVSQFQERIGEKAAAILIERLNGNRNGEGVAYEMPFQLVERKSV
ncbi:LacI family transcriptional regulator [Brucella pseudogrignonensis]|uniref:LacI family DNA-binding transcriptional regulator n=1 Tax=Brucella pseudogrignonensis TaxID=419475 RepID=UPI001E32517C|nr:LacI family DNA-binding transcriptional regulator [Brucella pseudogrignonensis]MCD4512161.1 LacI family transcriptional regulator [Brucella pseudogrignonensis]